MCEALGLDVNGQWKRLKNREWATVSVTEMVGADARNRSMFCLHIDSVPMWLATIQTGRVPAAVRPKLATYQKEAAKVLAAAFSLRGKYKDGDSAERVLDHMAVSKDEFVEAISGLQRRFDEQHAGNEQLHRKIDEQTGIIMSMKTELSDVIELVGTFEPANKVDEARALQVEVQKATGKSKQAILGFVRSTLGISRPYEYASIDRVLNCLRNMVGRGVLGIVKDDATGEKSE